MSHGNGGLWEEDPTAVMGLRCKIHPKCQFCGTPESLFSTKLIDFELDYTSKVRGQAIDVMLYCTECGYIDTFGVAIDRKHWEAKRKLIMEMMEKLDCVRIDVKKDYIKERNVSDTVQYPKVKLWSRTDDEIGHVPEFEVKCFHCGDKLTLRHSTIHYHPEESHATGLNQACYKCPTCAWFVRFNVIDDREYLEKVHEIRGRRGKIPSKSEWSEENEDIARQLEALGYFGGR